MTTRKMRKKRSRPSRMKWLMSRLPAFLFGKYEGRHCNSSIVFDSLGIFKRRVQYCFFAFQKFSILLRPGLCSEAVLQNVWIGEGSVHDWAPWHFGWSGCSGVLRFVSGQGPGQEPRRVEFMWCNIADFNPNPGCFWVILIAKHTSENM